MKLKVAILSIIPVLLQTQAGWAGKKSVHGIKLPPLGHTPSCQSLFGVPKVHQLGSVPDCGEVGQHNYLKTLEISSLSELVDLAQNGDWVFFEVDQVLLSSTPATAESNEHPTAELFSSDTKEALDRLRGKNVKLFGLTSQGMKDVYSELPAVSNDLERLGIEMGSDEFNEKLGSFYQRRGLLIQEGNRTYSGYFSGTIFVNHKDKGEGLADFFQRIERIRIQKPNRVLFVDHNEQNIESVSRYLEDAGINHLSFHFSPVRPSLLGHVKEVAHQKRLGFVKLPPITSKVK